MAGERVIIAGGGLAGALAALALAQRRPEVPLLLIEAGPAFGGNHTWSFFDGDVAPGHRALVEPLVARRWGSHDVRFPKRERTLATGYNSVTSERLDAAVRATLPAASYRLGTAIAGLAADHVVLADGERVEGAVLDARGSASMSALDLGWQKFVGREYRFASPHGLERPIIMDAKVDQSDGYRFVYCLPFSPTEMLVEDTYYTLSPELDAAKLRGRIEDYVAAAGWPEATNVREEQGVLPVAMGGDVEALWRDSPAALLGLRGGFFHPTTGYSLPDAVRNAHLLAAQAEFTGAGLRRLFEAEAQRCWRARGFYRLLNRMLFRAAEPAERYRVLEHFYRLDPQLIARFYAGRTTLADKARILSGRPPVRIGRAIAALAKQETSPTP
jgi:lycopene beta-cyclase